MHDISQLIWNNLRIGLFWILHRAALDLKSTTKQGGHFPLRAPSDHSWELRANSQEACDLIELTKQKPGPGSEW